MGNSMPVILYSIMILAGLLFIFLAVNQRMKAKRAEETWQTIPGVITNSQIQTHHSRNSKGQSRTSYEPCVNYQYQIMGSSYTGNSIGFGKANYDFNKANSIIAKYPQGATVMVHYNPEDPQKAVLETKASGFATFLAVGIIFLIIGCAALILTL